MTPKRRVRPQRAFALALFTLMVAGAAMLVSSHPVAAQDVSPCFEGAPTRTAPVGGGPSAVGRCTPPTSQSLLDNFVWAWLVGCGTIAIVVGIRTARRESASQTGSLPAHE